MTREEFIKREKAATRDFIDRHVMYDFSLPIGAVKYSRTYRCDCGYRTSCPGEIFDHKCAEGK